MKSATTLVSPIKNFASGGYNLTSCYNKFMVNKYTAGIALGIFLSAVAVFTNVIFPSTGSDDARVIGFSYLVLFVIFS